MANPAEKKRALTARLLAVASDGALTLLAGSGLLTRADLALSDALYQRPAATDGRVMIIGIDQKALEAYDPYQEWCREGVSQTLEQLNSSPDSRPAVIGIDILFGGTVSAAARRFRGVLAAQGADIHPTVAHLLCRLGAAVQGPV